MSLVITGVLAPLFSTVTAAGATSVGSLRARAAAIAAKVDTLQTKLSVLSEEYDQASSRSGKLRHEIAIDERSLGHAEHKVSNDAAMLRRQAIDAYVQSRSSGGISAVLSTNAKVLPQQQAYVDAASGSITTAIAMLHDSEHQLQVRHATLTRAEHQAQSAASTLASSRTEAMHLRDEYRSTLSGVNGELAHAVAIEQAREQRQAEQQAAAEVAVAKTAAVNDGGGTATSTITTVSATGSGAGAVRAAMSQIGVPYVWAGASPGGGFDCSGLTMWAWGQAGVSLPHSAEGQYESIAHVPLSDLQPGDLIFYASGGYVYHVIMYIGGGRAVQAENTGTRIQVTPVWPGAYGAGRP